MKRHRLKSLSTGKAPCLTGNLCLATMLNSAAGGEGVPGAFPVVNTDAAHRSSVLSVLKHSSVIKDDSLIKGREVNGQTAVFSHDTLCGVGSKSLHTAACFNCIC